MNRDEVMSFIDSSKKFGSKLELSRIIKLCELLGNPQESLKCIHIAGTNGKGSTSVFLNNILIDAGFEVGLYTSPFIYDFNERIQINNTPIPDSDLTEIMTVISQKVSLMISEGYEHPTEFELITAAAFLYFADKKCDYVVLEVGLGGVYDATNIIKNPVISIITSISLDHTEYLGNTLSDVAKNKCGIIKDNCPVLTYMNQDEEVLKEIERTAKIKNSDLTIADGKTLKIKKCSMKGNEFLYKGKSYKMKLLGKYQIYNAITAINAAEILNKCRIAISDENIRNGLAVSSWPARFEILDENPTIIADGSHNSDGMRAFVETASEIIDSKVICVFGMLKDKDYDTCLHMLSKITDTVIVTEVDNPRREVAENLFKTAKKYIKNVYLKKDNTDALEFAKEIANTDDTIIALGSLYMMSNIKNSIKKDCS